MLYEKLNYIITIAEEQNLTRAADRLHISQPTLTLYLNRLEAELGVKLFHRGKPPVTLTEAGQYYLDKMKKIYSEEQNLRNELSFIANPSKTLLIGIGQVRGHIWLPRILPAFCSIHPDINIQVVQSSEQKIYDELRQQRLDLIAGVFPTVADMETVDLVQERLLFVAHRKFGLIPEEERDQYNWQNPYPVQASALNGLPFIVPAASNGLYDAYTKMASRISLHPSRTISVSNMSTGLSLGIQGLGIQFLSSLVLQPDQEPGLQNLDFLYLADVPQTRKCIAVYHRSNLKEGLIRDFIRILKEEI